MSPHARRRLFAVAALTVAGSALAYLSASTMGEDIVYYWTPTELLAKGEAGREATVRIMGVVEPGSVDWKPEAQRLAFRVSDGAQVVPVVGQGAPPQMFREGIGVVVEGRLGGDGVFASSTVMVKHDNSYQPPKDGEMPEQVYEALNGGQP